MAATALSMSVGDVTDGSIILVIIAASGALGREDPVKGLDSAWTSSLA